MAQVPSGHSPASESIDAIVDAITPQLTEEMVQPGRIPSFFREYSIRWAQQQEATG
jgi:hypothetical protein